MSEHLSAINAFLACPTPTAWVDSALEHLDVLLIDHANCEKKAAAAAMTMIQRYIDRPELLHKMSRLAREELRHFEQVIALMKKLKIEYAHLSASRYASGLHQHVRREEPARLIDSLIVGAIIEARSCERFAQIAEHLEPRLEKFYTSLLKSEARHFQDYLNLAYLYAPSAAEVDTRIAHFIEVEQALINSSDNEVRFHSGILAA